MHALNTPEIQVIEQYYLFLVIIIYSLAGIVEETVYCTLVFGRQKFQSVSVPSIPARWDQSAELYVF